MKPYQVRVVVEKSELDERIVSLETFIDSPRFNALPIPERYNIMREYSRTLELRITSFKKT